MDGNHVGTRDFNSVLGYSIVIQSLLHNTKPQIKVIPTLKCLLNTNFN